MTAHRIGNDLGQRRTVHELHYDEVGLALVTDIEGIDDVGMREFRRRLRFLIETANELGIGCILLAKDLYCNATAKQNIGAA